MMIPLAALNGKVRTNGNNNSKEEALVNLSVNNFSDFDITNAN